MSDTQELCLNCGGRLDRPGLFRCQDRRHVTPTLAQRILADIEHELNDRRLGWARVHPDIAVVIRDRLAAIIDEHMDNGTGNENKKS